MPEQSQRTTRLERLALVAMILIFASVAFASWVDAQGPQFMRQRNPVARQSVQFPPATIVDAGDAAVNTASPDLFEYPGRVAFNKSTQCLMIYRDGGTWPTSGWEDICPGGGGGGEDYDWTYSTTGGTFLYPTSRDSGVAADDVRVSIGSTTYPTGDYWLKVGDDTATNKGNVLIQADAINDDDAILALEANGNLLEVKMQQVPAGPQAAIIASVGAGNIYVGTGGGGQWYFASAGGSLVPVANNTYDLGTVSLAVKAIYGNSLSSDNTGADLEFGLATTKVWRMISPSGTFAPMPTLNLDIGTSSEQIADIYILDEVYVGNPSDQGTATKVLHGGSPASWSAVTASEVEERLLIAPHTTIMLTATGVNTVAENVGVMAEASGNQGIVVALSKSITAGTLTVNLNSGAPADPLVTTTKHTISLTSVDGFVKEDLTGVGAVADNHIVEAEVSTDGSFDWTNSGTTALQIEIQFLVEN